MRALLVSGLVLSLLVVLVPAGGASDRGQATGAAAGSCVPRSSKGKGHRTVYSRARRVVKRYARETMDQCSGVEGMGVGALTEGDRPPDEGEKVHHIVIYLRDRASRPPRTRSIAGVTIVYVITGPIVAQ